MYHFLLVRPSILTIQCSLLRNSWIFRENESHQITMTVSICYIITYVVHMPAVICDSLGVLLSMAFSGKADQINWSTFKNSGTVFGFWCSLCYCHTRDNPVNWAPTNRGQQLIIGDEVAAIWLGGNRTWNGKTMSTSGKSKLHFVKYCTLSITALFVFEFGLILFACFQAISVLLYLWYE